MSRHTETDFSETGVLCYGLLSTGQKFEGFHFELNLLGQWKPMIIRGQSLLYLKEGNRAKEIITISLHYLGP
jgi:hypothetical protein